MYDENDRRIHFGRHLSIAEEAISRALRSGIRHLSADQRLTPTQAAILSTLRGVPEGMRLAAVAARLGVTPASASDSVSSLVEKRLLRRTAAPDDGRAVAIRLTSEGEKRAEGLSQGSSALTGAAEALSETEQTVLLRALMKLVRGLEMGHQVSETAMCVSCRHFRPFLNEQSADPHQCSYFDVDFDDSRLRFDCPGYRRASDALAAALWARFSTHGAAPLEPLPPYTEDET